VSFSFTHIEHAIELIVNHRLTKYTSASIIESAKGKLSGLARE